MEAMAYGLPVVATRHAGIPELVSEILVEEGDIREEHFGKTLHVAPDYDPMAEQHIGEWFEQFYSIRFRNYPVGREYLHAAEQVACG